MKVLPNLQLHTHQQVSQLLGLLIVNLAFDSPWAQVGAEVRGYQINSNLREGWLGRTFVK